VAERRSQQQAWDNAEHVGWNGLSSHTDEVGPDLLSTLKTLRFLDDQLHPDPGFADCLESALLRAQRQGLSHHHVGILAEAVVAHPSPGQAATPTTWAVAHLSGALAPIAVAALIVLGIVGVLVGSRSVGVGPAERDGAPAMLSAPVESPVSFVWASRGEPPPLQTRADAVPLLTDPYHLAIDPLGNIWVPDSWNNQFQILQPDGTRLEVWGNKGSDPGEFNFHNIRLFNERGAGAAAFDASGNLYVADPGNARIQKFTPDRQFAGMWGSRGEDNGQFLGLTDLAVDAQGRIYTLDALRSVVQVFDAEGAFLTSWGRSGVGDGEFLTPFGITVSPGGTVIVADTGNHRIQTFAPDGAFLTSWGGTGSDPGLLRLPEDVAADDAEHVFVTDTSNNRVQIFDVTGQYLAGWGERGSAPGQLDMPGGMTLDGLGNVYVSESGDKNERVQKFQLLPPFAP
jgi:DNA-binding beta-propeller fold protein YncE